MPERLYLLDIRKGRWANAVRAVRDARGLLYDEDHPSINSASDIVKEWRATGQPQLIGENDDLDTVNAAAELFADCALVEVNPIIETEERVLPEGDDATAALSADESIELSLEGVRAAIVTMGVAQGNAPAAMVCARFYFQATRDPVWLEVHHLIRTTFTPGDGSAPMVVVPPSPEDVA